MQQGMTLRDFANAENTLVDANMVLGGDYAKFAETATGMFSTVIMKADRRHALFMGNFSMVRKALVQAMLSALRQHRVQMNGNLRQAIEGTASMAYLIAHPEPDFLIGPDMKIDAGRKLNTKANKWLDANYADHSKRLQDLKNDINSTDGHSNIVNSYATFDYEAVDEIFSTNRYLDRDDEEVLKLNLWSVGHMSSALIDLIAVVAKDREGVVLPDDIDARRSWLSQANDLLLKRARENPRWAGLTIEDEQVSPP